METNEYFEGLKDELKQFCLEKDFIPTNPYEFNDFVRSYCELDNLQGFIVEVSKPIMIDGEPTSKVEISPNHPFYACVPRVWKTMTDVQKIQCVRMMFNYLYNQISPRLLSKPQLIFIDTDPKNKRLGAYTDKSNLLYVSLHRVLTSRHALDVLGALMHELTHAEQAYDIKNMYDYLASHNYDFLHLTTYQKHLCFPDSGIIRRSINNLYDKIVNGGEQIHILSEEDANLWLKLEKENNREWAKLKDLPYICNQNELSAENNNKKILQKVLNAYCKESCVFSPEMPTLLDVELSTLKDYGYDISADQVENFAQIGYLAHMTRDLGLIYGTVKYLLDIYKEKKVTRPFAENYQMLEDGYFSFLQTYYQQKNEETK